VVESCDHSTEHFDSIKEREFLHSLVAFHKQLSSMDFISKMVYSELHVL
jgi:hypothetical protein